MNALIQIHQSDIEVIDNEPRVSPVAFAASDYQHVLTTVNKYFTTE